MLRGKKLGLLLSVLPEHPNFARCVHLAEAAVLEGVDVYLYCIDDAVAGLRDEKLRHLQTKGLKLFACGYSGQRRGIPLDNVAIFSGLATLSDLIASADRFVSFN